jgi:hypothetical protein
MIITVATMPAHVTSVVRHDAGHGRSAGRLRGRGPPRDTAATNHKHAVGHDTYRGLPTPHERRPDATAEQRQGRRPHRVRGPPEDDDSGKIYKCTYGKNGTTALELVAREFPANGDTAASAIDAVGKASEATTTPVTGVGEAAVFYPTTDGTGVVLAGAKTSGDNIRVVVLAGPKILPQDKLTDVAAVVMERL